LIFKEEDKKFTFLIGIELYIFFYKMEEKTSVEEQSQSETVHYVERKPKKRRKLPEPGVIYLSKIPALMNVKTVKDIFSQYGEIGKIFLQPNGEHCLVFVTT
jgi:RNA recognition motif-containing protein